MEFKSFMEALKGKQHKIDKNKNGEVDAHDFELLRKEETKELDEALDPSEIAGNPKMYDAATVKKAYYHNKTTPEDKKTLERHLDRHHGMRDWRNSVKEETEELEEATVKTQKYSWGTMKTVHHGSDFSIPLHPEHHQEIAKLKDQQEHKFKTEDGKHWSAKRSGDDVHFQGANGGNSTTVKHSTMSESVEELDEIRRMKTKLNKLDPVSHMSVARQKLTNLMKSGKAKGALIANKRRTLNMGDDIDQEDLDALHEVLSKDAKAGDWIHDFVHSSNPKFEGKNKKERIKMALGAYYNTNKQKDGVSEGYQSYSGPSHGHAYGGSGFGRREREDDEYHVPDPVPSRSHAPVAPVPDKKYIKGTPENKALKASRKPINGHPTNEEVEEIEERNKENALMRKTMDASRGARYKLNNPVPDADPKHKTARDHNVAIGRALRNEDKMTTQKDKNGKLISFKYEGDWKKSTEKKEGSGKAANLAGQAMQKMKQANEEAGLQEGEVKDAIDAHRRTRMDQMSRHSTDNRERAHVRHQAALDTDRSRHNSRMDSATAASIHGDKERMARDTYDTQRRKDDDKDTRKTFNMMRDRLKNHKSKNEEFELDEKLTVGGGPIRTTTTPTGGRIFINNPENKALKAARKPINGMPTNKIKEAKDPGEYDQEGDMAKTQLRSIKYHADELHEMLGDNDNLPEWVQSKLTLAQDYLQTVCDYMYSKDEVNEEKKSVEVKVNAAGDAAHEEKWEPVKKIKKPVVESFDDEGNLIPTKISYKDFITEIKLADLPVRRIQGRSYGANYSDPEGADDYDDKKAMKPAGKRGPKMGSKRGARANYGSSKLHTK
jgi:hypothetical protein